MFSNKCRKYSNRPSPSRSDHHPPRPVTANSDPRCPPSNDDQLLRAAMDAFEPRRTVTYNQVCNIVTFVHEWLSYLDFFIFFNCILVVVLLLNPLIQQSYCLIYSIQLAVISDKCCLFQFGYENCVAMAGHARMLAYVTIMILSR